MSWRPWTLAAQRVAKLRGHKRILPEPIRKWNIVRGDLVEVLSGKDCGQQGKVVAVARRLNKVVVAGLNTHIRTLAQDKDSPMVRIASEAPLHVSNVALVDPADGKPCRVSYKFTEKGEKVRVSRRSGRIIPKPAELLDRKDFKARSGYAEGAKDTMADAVSLKTYTPSLKMFKEDITEIMNLRKNSHHSRNQH